MKIKPKQILLESLAAIFLIFGIEKTQVAYRSKEYLAFFEMDTERIEKLEIGNLSDFMLESFYWVFWTFGIVFIVITVFKIWKRNKNGLLNTLISFLIVFTLFPIGFFNSGISNWIVNYIGDVFSDELKTRMLIIGVFWSSIGLGVLWKSLKNTKHNEVHN